MKQDFINYMQLASDINEPYAVRKKIIAVAVGYAAACNIDLPSSPVTNSAEHYEVKGAGAAARWIGYFNEQLPMDVTYAVESARRFWIMRYNAVHCCPSLDIVKNDFFASLFGAPIHFDQDTIETLNKHNDTIAPIYRAACLLMSKWTKDPAF